MCVGLGAKAGMSAESHQGLLSMSGFCTWYSTVCAIFQLLAGKHQVVDVVVNHSNAAVRVLSAWELGRVVGTCSRPWEPSRLFPKLGNFLLKCRGLGPLDPESTGGGVTFILMVGPTGRRCEGPDLLGE